jgi:hypothetical protein
MLKKVLLWVLVAWLPSYSYSDSIAPYYGYTGNTAINGHTWDMGAYLPSGVPGLEINGVLYNYKIRKQTEDAVTVHVQNENATGAGYIFRETDEWLPGSLDGTQINKVIGLGNLHRDLWGDGSIEVEGNGSVEDANVVYTYKVTPCYDPQFDPNCPGYKVPMPDIPKTDYEIYDATAGDADQAQYSDEELYEDEEQMSDEEKAKQEEEEKEKSKERLEKALAAADNALLFANALAASQMLDTMNLAVNMNTYYSASIPGGVYKDTTALVDKKIPENRKGLRNGLAQQILHDQMVEMQYK